MEQQVLMHLRHHHHRQRIHHKVPRVNLVQVQVHQLNNHRNFLIVEHHWETLHLIIMIYQVEQIVLMVKN